MFVVVVWFLKEIQRLALPKDNRNHYFKATKFQEWRLTVSQR